MRCVYIWGLCLIVLVGCQVRVPVEPIPTPTATPVAKVTLPFVAGPQATATVTATSQPARTPTSSPTITLTPIPTLTSVPTTTPTTDPAYAPVVLIARPGANEFVTGAIAVTGKVANVASGVVRLRARTPDAQPVGPESVLATTQAVTDGLSFTGMLTLDLPPTPRQVAVVALWAASEAAQPAAEASQVVSILGHYPRVDRLIVETPAPFERGTDPQLAVQGVAPGPPAKIVARLLDESDQVLESIDATLDWYQPGLPCTFRAELPNNPAGTQLQVISLGPDDAVIEAVRVRLSPKP